MLIERQKRASRVRFKHPIRVVTLGESPRVLRTWTGNMSRRGLFLRMPEPLPKGTKVALSLEAGGRALALAQAEVVWGRGENSFSEDVPGCGVRFTEFMHPRAQELVGYLVDNLDRGKPLQLAPPPSRWRAYVPLLPAGVVVLVLGLIAVVALASPAAQVSDAEGPDATALLASTAEPSGEPSLAAPTPAKSESAVEPTPTLPRELEAAAAKSERTVESPAELVVTARPEAAARANVEPSGTEATTAKSDMAELVAARAEGAAHANVETSRDESTTAKSEQPIEPLRGQALAAKPAPAMEASRGQAEPTTEPSGAEPKRAAHLEAAAFAESEPAIESSRGRTLSARSAGGSAKAEPAMESSRGLTLPARSGAESEPLMDSSRAEKPAVAPRAAPRAGAEGHVKLPDGALASLGWRSHGKTLELTSSLPVARAFVLEGPPRAVFDVSGKAPARSHQLAAGFPHAKGVRVGKLPGGTRIVVDLDAPPRSTKQSGATLELQFAE